MPQLMALENIKLKKRTYGSRTIEKTNDDV